jgi:integrase/recombinase XerC
MRLQDALERFVVQLEADGRSRHTIDQYCRHIGLLARWLVQGGHSEDVDAIGHEGLATFLCSSDARGSRRGGQKRATSMNALRSSLRAFFAYVHGAGWSRENPARLIRRALTAAGPPKGLSDLDRERLLSALAAAVGREARRDCLLFNLLLSSGMRLSAALSLTDADVDLERGEVTLQAAKGNRVEVVFLSSSLQQHLSSYLEGHQAGPLFAGRDGRPMSRRHAARRLSIWMHRAGCRAHAHPHTLRHDFAGRAYRKTGDVLIVKQALGHRSILSTMVYAQTDDLRLRRMLFE